MKKGFILAICSIILTGFTACVEDNEVVLRGDWSRCTILDGVRRSGASVFVIGNNAYLVGGYKYMSSLNDTWRYDAIKDSWTRVADFPGGGRQLGVAFAVNGKGYYGTGKDEFGKYRADFYEYNPGNDTWKLIDSIPGKGIVSASGFGLGNYGYVSSGYIKEYGSSKMIYRYDPLSGNWKLVEGVKSWKCYGASNFIIHEKIYMLGGVDNNQYINEFYSFNPFTNEWESLNDLDESSPQIERSYAGAFSINGKGYITCGRSDSLLKSTWEYDPALDQWLKVAQFEGDARYSVVAFGIGNYGYVATGRNYDDVNGFMDDLWKFDPNAPNIKRN